MPTSQDTLYFDALKTLDRANKYQDFSPEIIEQLKHPQRIVEVSLPIKMDYGSTKIFTGWRVQHNNWRGPFKGGIRYHQQVSLDEVKS